MFLQFLWAFLVGGAICVVGQLLFDVAKLTPAHVMSSFVAVSYTHLTLPTKA